MPILAKLLLTLAAAQIFEPGMLDPDIGGSYDFNVVQLCDKKLHPVSPEKFSRIDYLGHGLFLAWSINRDDKFQYGKERTILTRDGKKLEVTVPKRTRFVQVFWLGAQADRDPKLMLSTLPKDALFRFDNDAHEFGLCTADGTIVLPAKYGRIGKVSEGKAFISDVNAKYDSPVRSGFYIFDCAQRRLKKLPLTDVVRTENLRLSEGLTHFSMFSNQYYNVPQAEYETPTRYIDANGAFVIKGKFQSAGPFHSGMAAVTIQKAPSATIDKSGKIISPPNLDVQEFLGDYAIARDVTAKSFEYGIVNRKFEFVVPPKFESLQPNVPVEYSVLATPVEICCAPALSYIAKENANTPETLISATGETLLTLPPQAHLGYITGEGLLRCIFDKSNVVYLDKSGNRISSPTQESIDSTGHRFQYQSIASENYLKQTSILTGHFEPELWQGEHNRLIAREGEWKQFLEDYDLIGMPEENLIKLLGKGDRAPTTPANADAPGKPQKDGRYVYTLRASCTGGTYAVIQTKDGRAQSWAIWEDQKQSSPSYTTDVLFDEQTGEVKPKSK
ncbi:MAG: WG repeat-containing protein [Candidatus Melainabacteria bacterium]|nr:MAG: WG repeat-containing protein [Candidatus Melainabacteria bacterium]